MGVFLRRRDRSKRVGKRAPGAQRTLQRLEPRYALTAEATGDAFLINDFLAGEQGVDESSVAVAASETNRVVVWSGRGLDDRDGVYARVFDADGDALGDSFRVNTTVQGEQHAPSVAVASDGSFVVVWAGRGFADKSGVFLQRYDANGDAVGEEVVVNTTLGGVQASPIVSVGENSTFVVAWEGAGTGDSRGVFFRRFNEEGAIGSETRANTTTTSDQTGVALTHLASGGFVVGWQSRHQDGAGWGVYTREYNRVGLTVEAETVMNTTANGNQTDISLTPDAKEGYVATWRSTDTDGDLWGIVAREVEGDGDRGDEVLVNATSAGPMEQPVLAVAKDGQWLAAWSMNVGDGAGWRTATRVVEADGTLGEASFLDGAQPGVARPGVVLVGETAWLVWSGSGADDGDGVYAQAFGVTLADDGDPAAPEIEDVLDREAEVGGQIEVTVTATDANSLDDLTFTLDADNSPEGATIEQTGDNTAVVRWTPDADDEGTTVSFRVVVTDDSDSQLSSTEDFDVEVKDLDATVDLNGFNADGTGSQRDFIVGDIAVRALAPDLEILGAAGDTLTAATARLLAAPDGDDETLSVSLPGDSPITAVYDESTRVLSLTGEATVAEYQEALRTLIYNNTAEAPSGTREVAVTVTDADGEGPVATADVTIVQPDLVAFAKALDEAGVTLYGAAWHALSTEQRELFQDGAQHLPFVDVTNADRTSNDILTENNITQAPTWEFADGSRAVDLQSLAAISEFSGVAIPTSDDPYFAEVEDQTLLVGSPLMVSLDGYDPNGGGLTYTVTSDNADVTAEILTGNRSIRIGTNNTVDTATGGDFGEMVFMLFEDMATRATDRVIELAEDGFYDGVEFHRIIDGFAIQGGDPDGTGSGGSDLGAFDDAFHADLQHNRSGLLSYAKSNDDTNDSQFFVTDGENTSSLRNLDFNHSVFGVLVEGQQTLDAVSGTAVLTNPSTGEVSDPAYPVRMDSVEVFTDTENAVLMLKAADGATGTANITVTVTDGDGNTHDQTFTVTLEEDTFNGRPFLEDIAGPIAGDQNTTATFQLSSVDVEGDSVQYTASTGVSGATVTVSDAGLVSVTPPTDFTGDLEVLVAVHREGNDVSDATEFIDGDFQVVTVNFS